jgi:hypothetical protein
MKKQLSMILTIFVFAMVFVLLANTNAFAGATITIVNADGAGEGFNDPTPAAPVGGNTGTTLGEQRLIAFQYAADIWGAELDSNQTIVIQAAFNPLAPNVLGSAGATFVFRDFPGQAFLNTGAEFPGTWYGSALADKRAGVDLIPNTPDINAQFSSNFNFYLGLDNNHGAQVDLVVVLLHEFGHGLNFQNFVNESTGTNLSGFTDIYARYTLDNTTGLYWDQMTNAERQASAINYGNVVWDGSNVNSRVPDVLSFGVPSLQINSPAGIAGTYGVGTASFGPPLSSPGITNDIVQALDDAGGSTTDGCEPITNGADVSGKIAIIDRGACTFVIKVKNAQDAGAIAVVIADNAPGSPPAGLGGTDPTIVIPSVRVTQADGNTIKAQLGGGVNGTLGVDLSLRAGADIFGRARLFMPNPVQGGSSGSHYDSAAFRNLLMEPAINGDLTHSVKAPEDLTLELLRDVGWFPDGDLDGLETSADYCRNSILDPTIVLGGVDSGVQNQIFNYGCTISDFLHKVTLASSNHADFVAKVSILTASLRDSSIITEQERQAIINAAASSNLP